ncbi:MAG: hypothetical protein ACFFB5_11170 [Promethearchaeota archaeon]
MPQLAKGGKYVYGWSIVHPIGKILIPKEAYDEYRFNEFDKIILLAGNSTSGGFGIAKVNQLKKGPFKEILNFLNYTEEEDSFKIPELKLMKYKNKRYFCWSRLKKDGYFILSPEILNVYGVKIGEKVLVVKGSGRALSFIIRGPIIKAARMHPELKIFK